MDKLLLFPGKSEQGIFTYVIDAERNYLEKTASAYHPTIAAYINEAKPIKGRTQILLTALGAGEYWGDNANGDMFYERSLAHEGRDYGHKTFEYYANIFKHHVNKDPKAGYGNVPLSVYNQQMHRVELIVSLENAKASDIVARIERGEYPDWSMGCKIPYDRCSICDNKAPTRKQYCEHLRYNLGRIDPETGKKVYAINDYPKFFDISYVLIGADRIAKTLKKVAHNGPILPYQGISSALLAEKMAAGAAKEAAMEKEVPANSGAAPVSQTKVEDILRPIAEVKAREQSFPTPMLNMLGRNFPLSQTMSTLAMLGILPKPQEFQRIYLVSRGQGAMADDLDAKGLTFDPDVEPAESGLDISHRNFVPSIMELIRPMIAERSYAEPHLSRRLTILIKSAKEEKLPTLIKIGNDNTERKPIGAMPMLAAAAALYALMAKNAPKETLKGVDKLVASHPGLAAALGLGLISTFGGMFGTKTKGNYSPSAYVPPDTNDAHARIEEQKQKPYLKMAGLSTLGPAANRLFMGIPAAYMASGILQKHKDANPHEQEGRIKSFIRRNPDVVSGLAVADAVAALRGKGTHGIISGAAKGLNHVKSIFKHAEDAQVTSPDPKTASFQEAVRDGLIWPLAMGPANLPGRVVGGLFDHFALEGAKSVIKRRQKRDGQS